MSVAPSVSIFEHLRSAIEKDVDLIGQSEWRALVELMSDAIESLAADFEASLDTGYGQAAAAEVLREHLTGMLREVEDSISTMRKRIEDVLDKYEREYLVVGVYEDNGQRFAETVAAASASHAESLVVGRAAESGASLVVAAVFCENKIVF